jgi:hypothetical protein
MGRDHLGDLETDGKIEECMRIWFWITQLILWPLEGSCLHSNEPSFSIEGRVSWSPEWLQLLEEVSILDSYIVKIQPIIWWFQNSKNTLKMSCTCQFIHSIISLAFNSVIYTKFYYCDVMAGSRDSRKILWRLTC